MVDNSVGREGAKMKNDYARRFKLLSRKVFLDALNKALLE